MTDVAKPQPEISVGDIDKAPDSLSKTIGATDFEKLYKEFQEKFTKVSESNFQLQQEIIELKAEVHTSKTIDKLIHHYANKSFWFMVFYSIAVGSIVVKDAEHESSFHVDTDVLKILIGSTAANVIGLVGMVLTGVFVGARKRK